jgi:hypothetical protein
MRGERRPRIFGHQHFNDSDPRNVGVNGKASDLPDEQKQTLRSCTIVAMILARTIIAGFKLGKFGVLASDLLQVEEIARCIGTEDLFATQKLIRALQGRRSCANNESDGFKSEQVPERWLLERWASTHRNAVLHRLLNTNWKAPETEGRWNYTR